MCSNSLINTSIYIPLLFSTYIMYVHPKRTQLWERRRQFERVLLPSPLVLIIVVFVGANSDCSRMRFLSLGHNECIFPTAVSRRGRSIRETAVGRLVGSCSLFDEIRNLLSCPPPPNAIVVGVAFFLAISWRHFTPSLCWPSLPRCSWPADNASTISIISSKRFFY